MHSEDDELFWRINVALKLAVIPVGEEVILASSFEITLILIGLKAPGGISAKLKPLKSGQDFIFRRESGLKMKSRVDRS